MGHPRSCSCGWPVLSLVMLSSLRVSYPFAFGAEGWVRTGVTQATGGWIFVFGAWSLVICGRDSGLSRFFEGVGRKVLCIRDQGLSG